MIHPSVTRLSLSFAVLLAAAACSDGGEEPGGTTGTGSGGAIGSGGAMASGGSTAGSTSGSGGSGSSSGGAGSGGADGSGGDAASGGAVGSGGAASGGADGSGGEAAMALSYATDVEPILTAQCMPCHTTMASGGLSLAQGAGYAALVDVDAMSAVASGMKRVAAGDSANSFIINKLEGTGGVMPADRMPKGRDALDQMSEIDVIKQWIDDGAEP